MQLIYDNDTIASMLTTIDAAKKIGVTDARIRQIIADGRLKADKFGGSFVIAEKDLAKYKPNKRGPKPKSRKNKGLRNAKKY